MDSDTAATSQYELFVTRYITVAKTVTKLEEGCRLSSSRVAGAKENFPGLAEADGPAIANRPIVNERLSSAGNTRGKGWGTT
jgi:hypothetical protein